MDWFRFYHGVLQDAKVRRLARCDERAAWRWVLCLCLASEHQPRGELPCLPDIAEAFQCADEDAAATLATLTERGFLEAGDHGGYHIHNWEGRQPAWQDDAARQRARRERVSRDSHVKLSISNLSLSGEEEEIKSKRESRDRHVTGSTAYGHAGGARAVRGHPTADISDEEFRQRLKVALAGGASNPAQPGRESRDTGNGQTALPRRDTADAG